MYEAALEELKMDLKSFKIKNRNSQKREILSMVIRKESKQSITNG